MKIDNSLTVYMVKWLVTVLKCRELYSSTKTRIVLQQGYWMQSGLFKKESLFF
jgi:hypothetical protein